MNKSLILTLILVTLVTPAICLGEWTSVATSVEEHTHYVDFDRITVAAALGMARDHDEYVYWWELSDYVESLPSGALSAKAYFQGDCNSLRFIMLSWSSYKQPMGKGPIHTSTNELDKNWTYPTPDSIEEASIKAVCDYVESKQDKE